MKQRIVTSLVISAMCISCVYEGVEPDFSDESYFPHTAGSRWKYELNTNCNWPMQSEICVSTDWGAAGPEIYENYGGFYDSLYAPMMSPTTTMQFIKEVDGKYYSNGWYMRESKFLDQNLEVGGTWEGGQFTESTFTIMEMDVIKKIRGKAYKNVIVVEEKQAYRYAPEYVQTATHYYARGVGEIYMIRKSTRSGVAENTWEYVLVEYYIAPKK